MARNLDVARTLAALGPPTRPGPSLDPTVMASLVTAELLVTIDRGRQGLSIAFLIGPIDALEYRPGDLLPIAVWHYQDKTHRWARCPAPEDLERLLPWFDALQRWLSDDYAADRLSDATTTAEAMFRDQSGLHIVSAEHVPAFLAVGKHLADRLVQQITGGTDATPTADD